MFLNQTTGSGAKPSQVSKDYANYFIFGPDSSNTTDYRLLTDKEFYFYTTGRDDQTYLDTVSAKLTDSLGKASNEEQKSAIRTQQELLKFYEISQIFLDDYAANYEIVQPEDGSLSYSYQILKEYISNSKTLDDMQQSYENEEISEQEYEEQVLIVKADRSTLRSERSNTYKKMAQYAKDIYEQ